MASIFEEMMAANHDLTEVEQASEEKEKETKDLNDKKVEKKNRRKFKSNHVKVESRKVFEETDPEDLEKTFEINEVEVGEEVPDEIVIVIDPEAPDDSEIPENAAEELVGELVYKCPVCGANYVVAEDAEEVSDEVQADEEGTPLVCPICGDDADQIFVGEIAPADEGDDEKKHELPLQKPEEEKVDEEEGDFDETATEMYRRNLHKRVSEHSRVTPRRHTSVKESELSHDLDKYQMWVDYDMKHYGHISKNTQDLLDRAGLTLDRAENGMYEVVVSESCQNNSHKSSTPRRPVVRRQESRKYQPRNRRFTEAEDVDKDVDDPEYVLDLDDKEDTYEDTKDTYDTTYQNDVTVKDSDVMILFDDQRFNSLMDKMMRENYHDNPTFRVTKVARRGNTLRVEYMIRQNGRITRGRLIGEGFNRRSSRMKIRFRDCGTFTESKSRAPMMVVEFIKRGRQIVPTRLNYDYKVRVRESLYRVTGHC